MKHEVVVQTVKKWLENQNPPPREVGEVDVDLIVNTVQKLENKTFITNHLQVECKKTEDYVGPAIGMCLRYYAERDGLFTYLAIPEDYRQFKELQDIFRLVNLPIGLIVVHNNGEVEVVKKAQGKERTVQLW